MGNVSNSRKQILLNTLDEEVSRYFDVSPPTNVSSGELPVVSDVFQLQIIEEDGDTQLTLRWMSGNERRVETKLCGGCKTIELNGKLVGLVGKLFGGKKVVEKPLVVVEKRKNGLLYVRDEDGENGWYKDSDLDKDFGEYIGEIVNGLPNGIGTIYYRNGSKYIGEMRDGKRYGQGTLNYIDGKKYVGEFMNDKITGKGTMYLNEGILKEGRITGEFINTIPWNTIIFDKKGNIFGKIVNGEWIKP